MSVDNENHFQSQIVNGVAVASEVSPEEIAESLDGELGRSLAVYPEVRRALASWAEDTSPKRRGRGIFDTNKYVTPSKIYDQYGVAFAALDDDIVGSVADVSEAIAFQKVAFETADDKDQEDIWDQIGRDLDLDDFIRVMWRELFTYSTCYPVRWWGEKTYKVRGKKDKRASRKSFTLTVPTKLGFLDPMRVVPVSPDPFGKSSLAYILEGDYDKEDSFASSLFLGPYKPSESEAAKLEKEGIAVDKLALLNPQYVWQHSLTKAPYERWSRVRMKSIFPLLDLKQQLLEMDRAFLLGGINFIVLVTRGSDQMPTTKTEVENTAAQVRGQSRSPIIVSDHRINIEIITPDVEHVLDESKHDVIDERLIARLWGMFTTPSAAGNRETSMTMGRVIARGLASRRHMMKRSVEEHVIRAVLEHPNNKGFDADTFIEFAPRRMELEFDQSVVTMIQQLRDRGDMSRETVLTEFGFDQELEAARREYEDAKFGDVFKPVIVPFDSPEKGNPDQSGRKGGRPPGQKQQEEES